MIPVPRFTGFPAVLDYLNILIKYLRKELDARPPQNTAVSSVLLASPNGSVYTVQVTDAGVLEAVLTYEAP